MPVPERIQELPARWGHLCLGVERFILRDLGLRTSDSTALLALSGGADSTALLVLFRVLAPRLGMNLKAAYLDHGIRPEARQEAESLRRLCAQCHVPLYCGATSVPLFAQRTGRGLEEAGRTLRYRFLAGVRNASGADYILAGHHLNDLAEDLLLRITRGSGWPELCGMRAYDPDSGIVRPLLQVTKQELTSLLQDLEITWHEDSSNQDPRYKRNRIRSRILPLIMEENPRFLQHVLRLWRLGSLDRQDLETRLCELRRGERHPDPETILLPGAELAPLSESLRLRWLKDALARLGPEQSLAENLFQLEQAWQEGKQGAVLQFPGDKRARVNREGIFLFRESRER
ncbi:MAG: tRNA lysidine(34) synthetase TilS [Desulfohalobiaceae bacterium]|nr:tRNA lysidine(34) synthetase TilS [Desulfohalobiaceae bacterium]